jgi:hypothetical protein
MAMRYFAKIAKLNSLANGFSTNRPGSGISSWFGRLNGMTTYYLLHCARKPCRPSARAVQQARVSSPVAHSYLSAIIGSVFAARRAGMKQAINATPTSNNAMPANVSGSVAVTSNNKLFTTRDNANAATKPIATPMAAPAELLSPLHMSAQRA